MNNYPSPELFNGVTLVIGLSTVLLVGVVVFIIMMKARQETISQSGLTRYSLLLDEQTNSAITRLQKAYGLKTKTEAYDLAVQLLYWATEQQVQGIPVGRRHDEGGFQKLDLPYADPSIWRKESENNIDNKSNVLPFRKR